MKSHRYGKQVTRRLLSSLLGAAACFAVVPSALAQTGLGTSVPQPPAKKPVPGTVPLTPQQIQNALSTSHQGLVEVPSSVPGGGVKIHLQGRFQSPLFATIDADGKIKIQHLHELPRSGDQK